MYSVSKDLNCFLLSVVCVSSGQVWDVLSNKEVVGIVASAPRSSAARIVVESAVQAWRTKLPASKIDDCSVVCLFFDSDSDLKSPPYTIDDAIPEAPIDQSDIGSSLSATNTLVDHSPEQSTLLREKSGT